MAHKPAKKDRGTVAFYAKVLGISKEGMRFLEEKKILHPRKDQNTNYKTYGLEDSIAVVNYKKYRAFGFDVDGVQHVLSEKDHEKHLELMQMQSELLLQEIHQKQKTLRSLNHRIARLSRENELLNQYKIMQRPALFWMETRKDSIVHEDPLAVITMEKWNRTLSGYADSAVIWTMEKLCGNEGHVYAGQVVEATDVHGEDLGDVHYSSPTKCLYSIHASASDSMMITHLFDSMLQHIELKEYQIAGDGIARVMRMFIHNNTYYFIWELMIPIL